MLTANHRTEHRDPSGGVRGRTERAEGVCNPIGRTTISTNQTQQSSQGLNHRPKSTVEHCDNKVEHFDSTEEYCDTTVENCDNKVEYCDTTVEHCETRVEQCNSTVEHCDTTV